MKEPDVKRAAAFIGLLHAFQSVERVAHAAGLSRRENDVEHSYFVAMFCWYLCDSLKLDYSKEKIFQYALAHDLVEAYAGDTFFFDNGARETKNGREESARVRMRNEFPEFADLHKTIEAYEHQNDSESRFVHAVDKLLPLLINYIQGGHTQKEMGVLRQEVYENKREKIGEQKEVRALLEQLIVLFEGDWEKYFVG